MTDGVTLRLPAPPNDAIADAGPAPLRRTKALGALTFPTNALVRSTTDKSTITQYEPATGKGNLLLRALAAILLPESR